VGKVSLALSSRGLTTGPGEAGTELVEGVSVPFFSVLSQRSSSTHHTPCVGVPSITLPSRQFPGLLCFGAGFFSLSVPFGLSLGSFLVGATLMVDSSSLGTMAGAVSMASIAREGLIPLILLADAAMIAPMGDGSWLMMEGPPS
jgi:hypothetical protein